jgi:arginyl-tRNA synthetase
VRNAVIGDTLVRFFRKAGFDVTSHYYVNDMGRQMAITVLGVERFGLSNKKPDHAIADAYISANRLLEERKELEKEVERLMLSYENGDAEVSRKFREAIEFAMEGIKDTLRNLGVSHDHYIWESEFLRNGYVSRVLEILDSRGMIKKNGAWIIEFGDIKEVVLRRENGNYPLHYKGPRIPSLEERKNYEKKIINVWGRRSQALR